MLGWRERTGATLPPDPYVLRTGFRDVLRPLSGISPRSAAWLAKHMSDEFLYGFVCGVVVTMIYGLVIRFKSGDKFRRKSVFTRSFRDWRH